MIKIRTWWTQHCNVVTWSCNQLSEAPCSSLYWAWTLPASSSPPTSSVSYHLCHTHFALATLASSLSLNTPRVSQFQGVILNAPFLCKAHHSNMIQAHSLTPFKSSFECHLPSQVLMTTLSLLFCSKSLLSIFSLALDFLMLTITCH